MESSKKSKGQRFNVALHRDLARYVREQAAANHRTINGEIVHLLESARKLVEARRDAEAAQ